MVSPTCLQALETHAVRRLLRSAARGRGGVRRTGKLTKVVEIAQRLVILLSYSKMESLA